MNRLTQFIVWIGRLTHSRGFGIQSPTDYRFVRCVINEQWPYYDYEKLDQGHGWLHRKVGRLLMRLANWRRPKAMVDLVGFCDYMQAGCRSAAMVTDVEEVELVCVPIACDYERLFSKCNERSVVVFCGIWKQWPLWHCIEQNRKVRVTFDLYYCGIVLFDPALSKNNYIVNF